MFVLFSVALAPGCLLVFLLFVFVRKFVPVETLNHPTVEQLSLIFGACGLVVFVIPLLLCLLVGKRLCMVLRLIGLGIPLSAVAGIAMLHVFKLFVNALVRVDVRLAKHTSLTGVTTLDPEECAARFEFPDPLDENSPPRIISACRLWVLTFYVGILKPVVGVMSAVGIALVLVLPVAAIVTLGDDPIIGKWLAFGETPASYVAVTVALWAIGVIALQIVARLSVKVTALVCGPWKSDQVPAVGDRVFHP